MAGPYGKTLRALSRRRGAARLAWGVALVIGAAWAWWAVAGEVPLYETSTAARLESATPAFALEASRDGRVIRSTLELGRRVEAGEVLVVLDPAEVEVELAEVRAQLEGDRAAATKITGEIETLERAVGVLERRGSLAAREVAVRLRQAKKAQALAASESERTAQLEKQGAVSSSEADRARVEGEQRAEEVSGMRVRLDLAKTENELEATQLAVRIAGLQHELAKVETTMGTAEARAASLELEIEKRRVRAPVSGTVASVTDVRVGSVLRAGAPVGSIVPEGDLKLVAEFRPRALGRIEPGQSARVRVDSLPWVEHGVLASRVTRVAQELVDGKLRVELALERSRLGSVVLRHGMTAVVDVVVDRATPARLALRAIGGGADEALDP